MNPRTSEQVRISTMLVHLMDKVNRILEKDNSDILSISDSEDTIGVAGRAIRRQHQHDMKVAGKQTKAKAAKSPAKLTVKKDMMQSTLKRSGFKPQRRSRTPRRWNRLALGSGCFTGNL